MDNKYCAEAKLVLTEYLTQQKLRKTDERYAILEQICLFPSHFDICMLHESLDKMNYHVSKATLYNTLEILLAADLIVKHQFTAKSIQYELKALAETHSHLICSICGTVREIRDMSLKKDIKNLKISRFTPMFHTLYIYGICSKCKYRIQKNNNKNNTKQ
ncbi:MAG: transcriptional repressor [Massilibacteroides sp.]|nr:transcriptional repressor [Massilibacteroides sp.]MDD3061842.1 transcriptional repressor [Massilibacteroides sp.]MDD4115506.1 transcriptional repressor [Massilibacteroides sp.]MDD4660566.1 transcriptional repressor [Massilibacteroides sp.]